MDWLVSKILPKSSESDVDSILKENNIYENDSKKGGKHIYDFDPSGLERASRAAQSLQNNPHAIEIIEQQTLVLKNRSIELAKEKKAIELKIEESKKEALKQQHDYTIEVLKEEAKTHRTKAEYEDFLARKRNEDRVLLEKQAQLEFIKVQEESIRRQEVLRRETVDYEFSKRIQNKNELSPIYWENKAEYKKKTSELSMSKLKLKLENKYKQTELVISSIGSMMSDGVNMLYESPSKFLTLTGGICLLTGGYIASKHGVIILMKRIESYFFTPKLIKERSKFTLTKSKPNITKESLESLGMFYNKDTKKKLEEIVEMTRNCKLNEGPLKNLLFYGPPGNGKTMFAKYLAQNSGLSYAILGGGDIVPLGNDAVTQLHKVFNWSSSSRGLILFLDEADAFLKQRGHAEIGENMRSALNTFLYRTGTDRSKNLMLILATNKPEELDNAVTDRIYMMVEFNVPNEESRKQLFEYYFNTKFNDITLDGFTLNDVMDEMILKTNNFSSREITNLCESFHIAALSNPEKKLFKNTLLMGLNDISHQHEQKRIWSNLKKTTQKTF